MSLLDFTNKLLGVIKFAAGKIFSVQKMSEIFGMYTIHMHILILIQKWRST